MLALCDGMLKTLEIFSLTLLFSMPLGLLIMFGRRSRFWLLRWITKIYISVMRGTPLMLQILVVYFGPYLIFEIPLSPNYRFPAVIIAFVINYAAYFAEIFRGGVDSMPKGQYEAAEVLGFNRSQTFCRIIFPQMTRRVLPSVTNEIITLVKDTSLAQIIAITEMFTLAKQYATAQSSMMPYLAAGIFYYVFNYLVAFGMERVEKAMSYYDQK